MPSRRGSAELSPIMANATNVLASGIEITGSIRFSNDMIIDGKIEGEIISEKGRVTIGENAMIKGNVTANGRIYHLPWSPWYNRIRMDGTKGKRWFCSEKEAIAAGWR